MGMTVDMSQVRSRIANLSELIKGNEQRILKQISQAVSGAAKDRAPVDEGHLTADIKGEVQETYIFVKSILKTQFRRIVVAGDIL